MSIQYNGLVLDNRPLIEKQKDWKSVEIFSPASAQAAFREVLEFGWKRYQIRNQDGSGSCNPNSIAKALEIRRFLSKGDKIKFSHAPIYIKRSNKPNSGMGVESFDITVKSSSCREVDMPSEFLNDAELDALTLPTNYEDINNLVNPHNYVTPPLDFDYVGALVEKEGQCVIWINTDYASWAKDIPTAGGKKGEVIHAICLVDAITFNGVRYLVVEDSWGKFGKYDGQRLLTKEAFVDMVFFARAFTEFTYDVSDAHFAPFKTIMAIGEKSAEVKRAQDFLKAKGIFPNNQESTGLYGNITADAVYAFQIRYAVADLSELKQLKGRRIGQKTLDAMNKLL